MQLGILGEIVVMAITYIVSEQEMTSGMQERSMIHCSSI